MIIRSKKDVQFNPFTTVAISKLLEIIGRAAYILAWPIATALDSDINLGGHPEYVRKSMHACHSVSVACRPAVMSRRRGEIGSVHRSILVGQIWPNGREWVKASCSWLTFYKRKFLDSIQQFAAKMISTFNLTKQAFLYTIKRTFENKTYVECSEMKNII